MRFRTWLVAALLFGSGFCALVYQIAWLRQFRLIFGASTAASAAVLAIFIGGLGLGGLLLGPRADRHLRPLVLYALLESIVAGAAAATPWLLALVQSLYLASGGSMRLGSLLATVLRLVLSAIVLAVPTIAMGGTLPAAARAATREADLRRQDVAALYALNTLGAVLGCLVATFWLLELFGTRQTIWLAAGINLVVALLAWSASRAVRAEPRDADGSPVPVPPATPEAGEPQWFLLTASAGVGFAFFLMELVWYRMLAPLLGGSVFTFGLVLAVALAGIGLGGLLYALTAADRRPSLSGFGLSCLIEAAAVAATYAFGDRTAILAATLLPLETTGFSARIAGWTVVTLVPVLLPALVAGYQFPLLIALFGRAREHVGRHIGRAYAANTLGAIAGSLAGGFGLLPWLSAPGAWRLVALTLLALGATAVLLALARRRGAGDDAPPAADAIRAANAAPRAWLAVHVAFALVTIACVMATGPTAVWRHSGIGAGRIAPAENFASPNRFREFIAAARHTVVWEGDGTESAVALTRNATGYTFLINGKADGSARNDAGTQVMSGLLGVLASPGAARALVIGLGTGSTAGWLGVVPSMERVDVVELEPLILEVARACAPVNRNVLQNPKVHVTIGDAREILRTSGEQYDIIASEPSNPYRAGVASLFTLEYYQAAANRLTDDGVFVQWVQAYEIDARTIRTIYATLASVFPQIETWHTNTGDVVLVSSKRQHTYRATDLVRSIAAEPFKSALQQVWRAVDIQGLVAHYVASDGLARTIARSPGVEINTDDRNLVEFGAARSVGVALASVADIRNAARMAGASRPPLDDDGAIRWPEVDTGWLSYNASVGSFIDTRYVGPPGEQARQAALIRYYGSDDLAGARTFWEQQSEPARDPTEMAMLADIAAGTASDAALPFIDRLRPYKPGEADVVLATLRVNQAALPEAAAAIETALTRFRTDPWSSTRFMDRAVRIAGAVASRDPSLARRMREVLSQPFAVRAVDDLRLITSAELTRQVDFRGLCAEAVGALEPDVPWLEDFLRLRHDCYRETNDARLPAASRDLDEFLGHTALPLLTP